MQKRTIKIIYWVITLLFAVFMLFSAISELSQTTSANKVLIDMGYPTYLNMIIGVAKVLGVIALIQSKFNIVKEWAYAGFVFDLLGAMFSFILLGGGISSVLFMLPFLIVIFTSYTLWRRIYIN